MNGDLEEVLYALFVTPRNAGVFGGAVALLFLLGVGLPRGWKKIYKENIAPYLAILLCSIAVWLSGTRPGLPDGKEEIAGLDGTEIGFRLVLGFILALLAYLTHRTFPLFIFWLAKKLLPERIAVGLEKAVRKVW